MADIVDRTARSFAAAIPLLEDRRADLGLKPSAMPMARHFLRSEGRPVCSKTLHHQKVGGMNARGRLHELRKAGFDIAKEPCRCDERCRHDRLVAREQGRTPKRVYAFRLVAIPKELTP
jgi:hypothetical protein